MNDDSDVVVRDEGSIFIVTPVSEDAKGWVEEHIPDDAQWFGSGFVVEHRYVADIVDGMIADGLTVN